MQIIHHRVNTLEQLKNLPLSDGAEIDIRYHENELILHHDSFHHHEDRPISLNSFLKAWNHLGPLILNLKCEGVEEMCIELMNFFKVRNWFFLDMSMPYFVRYSNLSNDKSSINFDNSNLAVRFSDYEPIEYAISFQGKVKWVWVDSFHNFPLSIPKYKKLKDNKFKLCLVSPELQGFNKNEILNMKSKIVDMSIDAVCTKYPELWK